LPPLVGLSDARAVRHGAGAIDSARSGSVRVVQITDTHLSPGKRHFAPNWAPLADWIHSVRPDLVVHTGDLSVDGADVEADLIHCAELLRALPCPVLSVPGNHDVGDLPGTRQPVDAERLDRWRRIVGPDRWVHDQPGWRLIGLNSQVIGAGSDEEMAQFAWLEGLLDASEGRGVVVFTHKPVFVDRPDEGDTGYWSLRPTPRRRLLDLLERHGVALVASGHLHRAWTGSHAGTRYLWAPASSFTVGPMERDMPGERILGAVIHTLDETVSSEIVALPTLQPFVIDDVIHEVYPRHVPAEAAS
jgi:3',5'-cyclic AMP phosphodiesterase CpdA